MRSLIICLSLLFSYQACAQLNIESPRVRAMPPGQANTAAFFTLHNNGKKDIHLISASTSIANKSEFHMHSMSGNGVMSMSRVMEIKVKAGQSFEFKSGGHHVMIMGLKKNLIPGESIQLILGDDKKQKYSFSVPVMTIMDAQKMEKTQHVHH